MQILKLTIQGKPFSTNSIYRAFVRGKRAVNIKSAGYRNFESMIVSETLKQVDKTKLDQAIGNMLRCEINIYLKNFYTAKGTISKTAFDVGNSEKALVDSVFLAFSRYAKLNDAMICDLRIKKHPAERDYFTFAIFTEETL